MLATAGASLGATIGLSAGLVRAAAIPPAARPSRLLRLCDALHQVKNRIEDVNASGDAGEDEIEEISEREYRLVRLITAIPARSAEDLRRKAEIVLRQCDSAIGQELSCSPWEVAVFRSLSWDVLELLPAIGGAGAAGMS
jgi:hypothetical protein